MSDILRRQVTDNIEELLAILPDSIRYPLTALGNFDQLVEIVMDLGRLPEARYFDTVAYISNQPVTWQDLQTAVERVGDFSSDNRAGIERTLHRISAIRNRKGQIIGLTCRVGRAIYGSSELIRDLIETGKSILLLGKPGMGKTTALREIARILADEMNKRVVIIDTSNEIAGDGDIPHPAIGKARRMQVAQPELQHRVMIEAVENHMPQVIVIDEIGTELEALAARTIAERGVQLIGTAHGNEVANLIKNPTLSDLIGGIQSVTLGDEEARRRGTQKSILERKAPPTFEIAVEMVERYRWIVHTDVADTIDNLLRGREPSRQIRSVDSTGKVTITHELPSSPELITNPYAKGWRSTGKMKPLPPASEEEETHVPAPGEKQGEVTYVYLYGVSRQQAEQVASTLQLPIVFCKEIDQADMVLTLRSHFRSNGKLRQLIESRDIPVHTVKSNALPQITRALRRMLHLDEPLTDLYDFAYGDSEDELEALEEARLAVEQIVIPKRQAVELLPRSASIRKLQHELVEHYQLRSDSFGVEPNRRLRIYPW
ncbi:MAG: R3H domain-containing nucleic acid-binding protein [Pseudanabaenaceae cyanobacterium SKYGB_i_bin29]|nr:AAA family ATPase [Pseudanabaenaceae cyanobacterium SKYG29]MDW8420743.1 R3H domain-containing nucleic acid-binding protein [Pseudanabaenaceae cyanobacterium SKYGB_i_bin29]